MESPRLAAARPVARRAALACACVCGAAAAAAGACRGDRDDRAAPAATAAPGGGPTLEAPDEAARQRADETQRRARECEAVASRGDARPCQLACDLGHSNSCARLAATFERAGEAADLARALALYRQACAGGSGGGCQGAAGLFARGAGVVADEEAARGLYARARIYHRVHCAQRYAASCQGLGELYEGGLGGEIDLGVAYTFYTRACELGAAASCASAARLAGR